MICLVAGLPSGTCPSMKYTFTDNSIPQHWIIRIAFPTASSVVSSNKYATIQSSPFYSTCVFCPQPSFCPLCPLMTCSIFATVHCQIVASFVSTFFQSSSASKRGIFQCTYCHRPITGVFRSASGPTASLKREFRVRLT